MQIKRMFTNIRRRTTLYLRRIGFLTRTRFFRSALFIPVLCLILCYSLTMPFYAFVPSSRMLKASAVPSIKLGKGRTNAPHRAIQTAQKARWRDNEILVRFRQNVSQSDVDALLQANGAQRTAKLRGQSDIERLRIVAGSDPEAVAISLRTSPLVNLAEPNYLITADQSTPDDPRYSEQWALKNTGQTSGYFGSDIKAEDAWAVTTGSSQTVIAVIDSGIDFTHPELKNNEWNNTLEKANNHDNDNNGFVGDLHGWDFITNTNEIKDEQGHGTAVAGIIAAEGNNTKGITGVMWRASLMSLRVLDNTGTGDVASAIEAIDYAVQNGAQVINCSWGTDGNSTALREAINWAARRGVIVVTSAGNQSRDIETAPRYPASYDLNNIISVASTDNIDLLASFSNWGARHVTIAAPGKDILTTKMGGDYQTISGTSASAAFVTGVVGLLKTMRPWLSAARTRQMILQGVRQVPSLSDKIASKGVVSAAGALNVISTLRPTDGLDANNGNNGGEHIDSKGNSRSSQGSNQNGNNGSGNGNGNVNAHDGHEFNVTPPARTQGAPGSGLPNLDELRRKQPVIPQTPAPIPSTRCSHRNPQCLSHRRAATDQLPLDLLAWKSNYPLLDYLLNGETPVISDSPFSVDISRRVKSKGVSLPPDALSLLSLLMLIPPQTSTYKIAFSSNRDGNAQVYVMNTDGSNQTRLTNNTINDEYPKWSPNSTRLVFQSDRDNPFSGSSQIYVMNSDGSGQTRLTYSGADDSLPVWSPDGSKIAFQSLRNGTNYQVYVMNSDGSNQVNVSNSSSNDGQPSWSPDGTRIAFTSDRDHAGLPNIYVMQANGSQQTRLTTSAAPFRDEQPAWSPDGTKIAFVSTLDSVIDSWTETDDDGNPVQRSAVRTNKEVYVMNSDGSLQVRLMNSLGNDDSPAWSNDGTKIVFRSERERDWSDPIEQVWVMNADGSNQADISNNGSGDYSPNWQRVTAGNIPPTANAGGPYSGARVTALQFNGSQSSDPDGTITSYQWSFGDGTTGSTVSPTHAYTSSGSYSVTLVVTDNYGAQSAPVSATVTISDYSVARLDPVNRTGTGGVDLLSGNANWSLPILGLKGRAGLDLGLSLTYNSLVWTKDALSNSIKFDADQGSPSPGFRLGFPVIQPLYYNSQVGVNAYLLITPSGSHVELRATGAPGVYESADSSYLQLIDNGNGNLTLRPTDGSQLSYLLKNGEYQCVEIKDRNGNFITIDYWDDGRIKTVTDTLSRVITFNYDGYLNLNSITQAWGGVTHQWATFGWSNLTISTSFSGLTVVGPQNGTIIPVLNQVSFADGTHYNFDYNSYAQVTVIHHYAQDNHQLSYTSYTLPASPTDCPRVTESHEYAENWNSNQEAVTTYSTAADYSSGQETMPDGTIYKELFSTTSWQRGLTTGTEYWSGGVKKKWTTTAYTQDDENLSYQKNARVIETNIYDVEGNRKRTTIDYGSGSGPGNGQYARWGLPYYVTEYASDGVTLLRRTFTDYNLDQAYIDRHIIGLVSAIHMSDGAWQVKTGFEYDAVGDQLQATSVNATQHDASYDTSFTARGNLTLVSHYDVTDIVNESKKLITRMGYDTDGSVIFTRDPSGHQSNLSYTDSFSDNVNRNTFAYPTVATDADGNSSTIQYNYELGATTRTQTPSPLNQTQGAIETFEYDLAGRISRVNNLINNSVYSYKRLVYDDTGAVKTYSTIGSISEEAYSVTIYDGAGRVRGTGGDNPNSQGLFSGQYVEYDVMGRVSKKYNPTEMTSGWAAAGDDSTINGGAGWVATLQQYDWKGRPTLTTNTDGTTKETSYGGCGCAGGEVVTVRDEVGRQQRTTADALGRDYKQEVLNWDGSVYSTVVNSYNSRDQITNVRHYQGTDSSNTYQESVMSYDGYGRLQTSKAPEQTSPSSYTYNTDGTTNTVTDARGATSTFSYNSRHLVTAISYSAPSGITPTLPVSFSYDSAGNRIGATDGQGNTTYQYDQLSRLTSETRAFTNVGSFTLSYSYNLAGELTSITDPWNVTVGYSYDQTGRLSSVTSSGYAGVTSYASNLQYRAWGAIKHLNYGNNLTLDLSYNARQQLTRYLVNGGRSAGSPNNVTPVGSDYQYYADSNIRFASDFLSQEFDRAYRFDHLARLSVAYTGAEARDFVNNTNSGVADGPYRQSHDYDVWNNLIGRDDWFWSQSEGFADTYINNRNQNLYWQYDADGNVTQDEYRQHTYDAAGRKTQVTDTSVSASGGTTLTLAQAYDGDGQQMKRAEQYSNNVHPSATSYYVRSSVLGRVITEVDQSGQKMKGYVYAGGNVLAQQQNNAVVWVHTNPVTGGQITTDAQGYFDSQLEFDPLGGETGFTDPYQQSGTPDYVSLSEGRQLYLEGGNPFDDKGGCELDGMPVSCSDLQQQMEGGSVAAQYLVRGDHGLKSVQGEIRPLGLGMFERDYPKPDNEGWHWGVTISSFDHAQNTNPQNTAGQKCDERLARIFGDKNAVFATDHDPSTVRNGPNRNRLPDPTESPVTGNAHLFATATGEGSSDSYAYTPKGFYSEFYRATVAHQNTAPEDQNHHQFYYAPGALRSYGYSGGLMISFIHIGPTDADGNPFPAIRSKTNAMGNIAVGIIGGYNNYVNGEFVDTGGAGTGGGNVHTHMKFYKLAKNGGILGPADPRKVFCSDLGFR